MKVKALCRFTDLEAWKIREKDEEFVVTAKRGEYLMNTEFGALVEEVKASKKADKE